MWPPSAANEGIDYCAAEIVAAGAIPTLGASSRAGAVGSKGGREVMRPEMSSVYSSFAWVVQKQDTKRVLVRTENLSPSKKHLCTEGGTFWDHMYFAGDDTFFCCHEVICVALEISLMNQLCRLSR